MNLVDWLTVTMPRRHSFDALERAYAAYAADPSNSRKRFAAMRALLKMCRLHDLSGEYAAMLAELGRVDDEAPAHWQITFQRRKPTRPHREKHKRDKSLHTKSTSQNRQWRRFMAVMDKIAAGGTTLDAAFSAVASDEPNLTAETVRKDYHAIASQYRRVGLEKVKLGSDATLRQIDLPRPGRPRKMG